MPVLLRCTANHRYSKQFYKEKSYRLRSHPSVRRCSVTSCKKPKMQYNREGVHERYIDIDASKARADFRRKEKKTSKTYNSGYSLVITHLTTNPPARCLNRAILAGRSTYVRALLVVRICSVLFYCLCSSCRGGVSPPLHKASLLKTLG